MLVVDDERDLVDLLELQLATDLDVTKTTSPAHALALVREQRFDAIVSDLRMPELDGVTLLDGVKRVSPHTARLLLTADDDFRSAMRAINTASVHAILSKPWTVTALRDTIHKAIAANNGLDGEALLDLGRRAALGALASSIGHEMGNLMAALDTCVSAVRAHVETGQAVDPEDLSILDIVNLRLRDHTRHLVTLTQPRELVVEDVDVASIVMRTIAILQRVGTLRMAHVSTEVPDDATLVRADAASLESVLINLLKNAAEAVESRFQGDLEEGRTPAACTVDVKVRSDDDRVTVEVIDNGCGIPRDRLERLFEPFRTTKGARGNGLGLGIARSVLERQGGCLTVSSAPASGTRFVVSLPRFASVSGTAA